MSPVDRQIVTTCIPITTGPLQTVNVFYGRILYYYITVQVVDGVGMVGIHSSEFV